MLKLLSCLPWCKPKPQPKPQPTLRLGPRKPDGVDSPSADEDRQLGCGWFDSSHELERGLQVQEADAQALSALPLGDWLNLELRTWCGQLQPR